MNLGWLKDFIAVAELGSFSRAADSRAITQPAMSRHIKGLEDYVGFQLIDRTNFPATLTPAGEKFYGLARNTLIDLDSGIATIRQQHTEDSNALGFAMQHVLAAEFFSRWWQDYGVGGDTQVRVDANNIHDCVQLLVNGHCDFLICYHHPSVTIDLDPDEFSAVKIGADVFVPVSAANEAGDPLYDLAGDRIVPVACSGSDEFMGKVVDDILSRNKATGRIKKVYQDSFSEGVRSQALIGTGLAWLPLMLVQQEVTNNNLVMLEGEQWQQPLDIFLYCEPGRIKDKAVDIWHQVSQS